MKPSKPWEDVLQKSLEDPETVLAYLNTSLHEEDEDLFLISLKNTAKAKLGGMTALAEATGLSRESLYRTLSTNGNPRFSTLLAVLDVLGYKISIEPKKARKKTSKRVSRSGRKNFKASDISEQKKKSQSSYQSQKITDKKFDFWYFSCSKSGRYNYDYFYFN